VNWHNYACFLAKVLQLLTATASGAISLENFHNAAAALQCQSTATGQINTHSVRSLLVAELRRMEHT
jgi:hypothetical protein